MDKGDEDDDMSLFGPSDEEDGNGNEHRGNADDDEQPEDSEEPVHAPPPEGHHPPEGREPVTLPNPIKPSAEGIEKHFVTHLPYRSWCEVCTRAIGREDPYRRGGKRDSSSGS